MYKKQYFLLCVFLLRLYDHVDMYFEWFFRKDFLRFSFAKEIRNQFTMRIWISCLGFLSKTKMAAITRQSSERQPLIGRSNEEAGQLKPAEVCIYMWQRHI